MSRIHAGEQVAGKRGIEEADEKFNIISQVCTGAMMKIFPCRGADGKTLEWYSQSDQLHVIWTMTSGFLSASP